MRHSALTLVSMGTLFRKLSEEWNADPNCPYPEVTEVSGGIELSFRMNHFMFPSYSKGDVGVLSFFRCARYRLGETNDEGWYRGQCRFSHIAPAWGEFYEVSGNLLLEVIAREDWQQFSYPIEMCKHFLFYFRDETFECDAETWRLDVYRQGELPSRAAS